MLEFVLSGRSFIMRDMRLSDAGKYLEFFNGLSEESIRCRFGHLIAKLTESSAMQRISPATNEKVLAIFEVGQDNIAAVGRCCHEIAEGDAEIALVVAESKRRLGLARFLLQRLVEVAREQNCGSVSGYIATKNAPVIKLLKSEGFVAGRTIDDDLKLTLELKSAAARPGQAL